MPELPEVEAARRLARQVAVGRRIVGVHCAEDPIVYERVTPARVRRALTGRRVVAAHRWGKHLWLELDGPPWPCFHFGVSGGFHAPQRPGVRLRAYGRRPPGEVWPPRFAGLLRERTAPVKAVLLDQSFAAGVGNWIADEVLYQAGIAPHRRAHTLSDDEARRLRARLRA